MSVRLTRSMTSTRSSSALDLRIKDEPTLEEELGAHEVLTARGDKKSPRLTCPDELKHSRTFFPSASEDVKEKYKEPCTVTSAYNPDPTRSCHSHAVVPVSLAVPTGDGKETEIKKEIVSSEYTLEWWYDMGPTSPKAHDNDAALDGGAIVPKKSENVSGIITRQRSDHCGNKTQSESHGAENHDIMLSCKQEYDEKDPVIQGGSDTVKLDEDIFKSLDSRKKLEFPFGHVDCQNSPTTLASSACEAVQNLTQDPIALNLTVPKLRTNESKVIEFKQDNSISLTNQHYSLMQHSDQSHFVDNSGLHEGTNVQHENLPSTMTESLSSFPPSFSQQVYEYRQVSTFPWTLGLCRAPTYLSSAVTGFKPFPGHLSLGSLPPPNHAFSPHLYGVTSLPVSSAVVAHTGGPRGTPHAFGHVAPTQRFPDTAALQNLAHPLPSFPGHGGRVRYDVVSQHPGIVFLTSQSILLQQFPYLALFPPSQVNESNHGSAGMGESLDTQLPVIGLNSLAGTKEAFGSSLSNYVTEPDLTSTQETECIEEERHSENSSRKAIAFDEANQCQEEKPNVNKDKHEKKSKISRKAKFMEALGFVDPTRIKLSQDDEGPDNELVSEFLNEGHNSSDEDWVPEMGEGKTREYSVQTHDDSSTDEMEKQKRRKTREGRRHRSNTCRRGRPVANAIACPTCGKVFHGRYHLKRHEMSHTETRPYECMTCGKKFKQKAHLRGHEMIHQRHKNQYRYKGEKSQIGNQIDNMNNNKCSGRPKKSYTEKELSCATCNKSFKTVYRLKRHVQSHTDERPYSCRICGKGFKQTGHRNEHEANHEKNRRKFLCNMCGVIFRCRSSFNNHLKGHRGETQQQMSSRSKTAYETNLGEQEDGGNNDIDCQDAENRTGYDCPYCSDKFSTAQGLNRHLDSHIEIHQRLHVQPYTCKHCSRSFTYKHNLLKHMLAHLAPEKYAMYHKAKLEQHVASGKPYYKCNTCSKMFIRKETLVKHSKIHTGCKPFRCMVCGKEFSQNVHLKVHMRKHTGNRPFQCKRCNRGFIDSTALAKHIEYEACVTENVFYVCKICDKRHYYLGSIKQHIQRHHKKTSDIEGFIHRIQRQQHKSRRATNEKSQHTCQACSSTFTEKGNLVRHVRRKHKDLIRMLRDDLVLHGTRSSSSGSPTQATGISNCYSTPPSECYHDSAGEKSLKIESTNTTRNIKANEEKNRTGDGRSDIIERIEPARVEGFSGHVQTRDLSQHLNDAHEAHPTHISCARGWSFRSPASGQIVENDQPGADHRGAKSHDPMHAIDIFDSCKSGSVRRFHEVDEGNGQVDTSYLKVASRGDQRQRASCHPNDLTNDDLKCCVPEGQNASAVSFLYQFGLMVSDKAKRIKTPMQGDLPKAWTRQDTRNSKSSSLGKDSINLLERDPSVNLIVPSRMTADCIEQPKNDTFTVNFTCRSRQPQSDLELFCNLALKSEDYSSSGTSLDKTAPHRKPDVTLGDSYMPNLSETCKRHSAESHSLRQQRSLDRNTHDCILSDVDPSEVFGKGYEEPRPSSKKTYSLVKPWLRQLFGQSPGCQKRGRRSSIPLVTMDVNGESGQNKRKVASSEVDEGRLILELDLSLKKTHPDAGYSVATKSMCGGDMLQSKKSTMDDEENSKSLSDGHGTDHHHQRAEVSSGESQIWSTSYAGHVRGDTEGYHHDDVISNKSDSSASTSTLVICMSDSNQQLGPPSSPPQLPPSPPLLSPYLTSQRDDHYTARLDDQPTVQKLTNRKLSLLAHSIAASGDMTFTSSTTQNASREVMTQTQSPHRGAESPIRLISSPLTMTFVLGQSPDDLSTANSSAGNPTSGAGLPARSPVSNRRKEPFPCQTCGKCFNARHQLKRHEMTHTEIRPYRCPECGRAFRQKVHLSDHLKRHGGQRPFACQACGKRFVLKNELKQHTKNYCRKWSSFDADLVWQSKQLLAVTPPGDFP